MTKIEIYRYSDGEVVNTVEIKTDRDRRAFDFYFVNQCNTAEYGYRMVENENAD